jgi:predicted nucleic acid-binding protein
MLAVVESAGAIYRRSSLTDMAAAVHTLRQLAGRGYIVEYQLDEQRRNQALSMVGRYKIRGADAVFVALAEELQLELLTTDRDFRVYPNAIVPV